MNRVLTTRTPFDRLAGPLRPRQPSTSSTRALRAGAVGALAIGACAVGAVAIGALAINRLAVKRARIAHLSIGTLEVDRLIVREHAGPGFDPTSPAG
jgi:hypothetical protein